MKDQGDPCIEITPGEFWGPDKGERTVGLNIEAEDVDNLEDGQGCNFSMSHIMNWVSGNKRHRKDWGTLILHPGPNPLNTVHFGIAARDRNARPDAFKMVWRNGRFLLSEVEGKGLVECLSLHGRRYVQPVSVE